MAPERLCIAAALLVALAGPASADPDPGGLERARAELGELRYGDALATLDKALAAGTSGPSETAEIYLLLGEVRASLDEDQQAQQAFERALVLDPGVELRKGVSPKISRPFRKARRARRGSPALAIGHQQVSRDPIRIAVVVQSDPLAMVAGASVVYWSEGTPRRSVSADARRGARANGVETRFEIELPRGARRFTVAGIDEHGNRLVELGSAEQPLAVDLEPPAPAAAPLPAVVAAEPEAGRPFYAHWLLWGGVAVAAGAAGAWAGLSARSAEDELDEIRATQYVHEYAEAKRLADRAERRSLVANVCFAGAGAAAVVSGFLFFQSRRRGEDDRSAVVGPLLGPDQVGIAASLRF
jgi:hypothetical protein